ncbi:MAG: radical SAM protein [candidate division WOR-3 bacterium]
MDDRYCKLILFNNSDIIFLPNSFRIFSNQHSNDYQSDLKKLIDEEISLEESYLNQNHIEKFITTTRFILNRCVLGISNACNFACKYCYAGHGNYGSDERTMDFSVVKETIEKFYKAFTEINTIQFFGGEPFLAFETITYACNYISMLYKKNIIKKMPRFGITTNGSILDDTKLKILKKYDIAITVSLDGWADINNKLRKYKNGLETSNIVEQNIYRLKKENIRVEIEATYTNIHIEENIGVFDILEYFYKKFGPISIHIPPVSAGVNENSSWRIFPKMTQKCIENYREAINKSFKTWIGDNQPVSFSFLDRYLHALLKKNKMHLLCPAYLDTLAVWYNGDIYPCFMFWGNKFFRISNVFAIKPEELIYLNFDYLYTKLKYESCRSCWARWLCSSCIGAILMSQGNLNYPNQYLCEFNRAIIEEVILNLAKLRLDEFRWNTLIANLERLKKTHKL